MNKKGIYHKKIGAMLLIVCLSFCFISCAGKGFRNEVQSEFETGMTFFNQGKYKDGADHFEKAIKENPDFANAYLYLGRSYLNLGDFSKAIPPLKTAYRLSPEEVKKQVLALLLDALFNASGYEWNKGRFNSAIDYLKEAVDLDPNSQRAKDALTMSLINLGAIILDSGDARQAIVDFNEAIKISPNNVSAYLGLAAALLKNGDTRKALEAAIKAALIDPKNRDALRLMKDLMFK
jgi:tetratricopeptide (TPR) repeat protein